jgi:molybdenum cofactor cytidylyltransferase
MSALAPPPKVAAIVLAAGSSSRFGSRNKLIEKIDGAPMVVRVVALALASGASPVIAVTGFEAQRVAAPLRGLGVRIVHNPLFGEGLSASLRAGLGAVPADCDGALVLLGDMPRVELSVVEALLSVFAAHGPEAICVPVRNGRLGNPLLWGRSHFPEMMALAGDRGAKALLERHAANVVEVEVATDSVFEDFDLASDFARGRA